MTNLFKKLEAQLSESYLDLGEVWLTIEIDLETINRLVTVSQLDSFFKYIVWEHLGEVKLEDKNCSEIKPRFTHEEIRVWYDDEVQFIYKDDYGGEVWADLGTVSTLVKEFADLNPKV